MLLLPEHRASEHSNALGSGATEVTERVAGEAREGRASITLQQKGRATSLGERTAG